MAPDIREKLAFPPNKKISRVVLYYLVFSVFLLLFIKLTGARAFRDLHEGRAAAAKILLLP